MSTLKDCFVTGDWGDDDATKLLREDDLEDEELFGDFEDLEGMYLNRAKLCKKIKQKNKLKIRKKKLKRIIDKVTFQLAELKTKLKALNPIKKWKKLKPKQKK